MTLQYDTFTPIPGSEEEGKIQGIEITALTDRLLRGKVYFSEAGKREYRAFFEKQQQFNATFADSHLPIFEKGPKLENGKLVAEFNIVEEDLQPNHVLFYLKDAGLIQSNPLYDWTHWEPSAHTRFQNRLKKNRASRLGIVCQPPFKKRCAGCPICS